MHTSTNPPCTCYLLGNSGHQRWDEWEKITQLPFWLCWGLSLHGWFHLCWSLGHTFRYNIKFFDLRSVWLLSSNWLNPFCYIYSIFVPSSIRKVMVAPPLASDYLWNSIIVALGVQPVPWPSNVRIFLFKSILITWFCGNIKAC